MEIRTTRLPLKGRAASEVLDDIRQRKSGDQDFDNGRMFGYVYQADEGAVALMKELAHMYMFENALNATVFPSIAWFEREVVSNIADLMNGDQNTRGNLTSGGTDSIFHALKASRDLMREQRPEITTPEVILPESVHPAFHKATSTLGLKEVTLPLRTDYQAEISGIEERITKNTILIAGSAPSYPHGVIDPITDMAAIARDHGILFHTDACLGGYFLPFMEMLGYDIPAFDFRVPGVTSISVDMHKYGYGIKGTSVVLYHNPDIWKKQFFVFCNWPAGMFGTPTYQGSRSGVPAAISWALMQHYGLEGYLDLTRRTMEASEKLMEGIRETEGLRIVGDPLMSVFAFTSEKGNIYNIGEAMETKGWILDRIMQPEALHVILTYPNIAHVDSLLHDLQLAVEESARQGIRAFGDKLRLRIAKGFFAAFPKAAAGLVASIASKSAREPGSGSAKGSAVFYGITASVEDDSNLDNLVMDFLESVYSPQK